MFGFRLPWTRDSTFQEKRIYFWSNLHLVINKLSMTTTKKKKMKWKKANLISDQTNTLFFYLTLTKWLRKNCYYSKSCFKFVIFVNMIFQVIPFCIFAIISSFFALIFLKERDPLFPYGLWIWGLYILKPSLL